MGKSIADTLKGTPAVIENAQKDRGRFELRRNKAVSPGYPGQPRKPLPLSGKERGPVDDTATDCRVECVV